MSKRLILGGGVLAGLLAFVVPVFIDTKVQAAVEVVGEPFALSQAGDPVRYIQAGNYPYNPVRSNWPLRTQGSGCTTGASTTLKALYQYPGPTPYAIPGYPGIDTQNGDDFGLLTSCGGMGWHRLWTDAGTNTIAPWAGSYRGAWINPDQYGGWGLRGGVFADNAVAYGLDSTCSNPAHTVTASKVGAEMITANPIPMVADVDPVWGDNCRDLNNWLMHMFGSADGRNHYSNATVSSWAAASGVTAGENLTNHGTTLFRNDFQITADDMARIQAAEARGSQYGLFLDIVADDFFMAYINNAPRAAATITVDRQLHKINSTLLIEGDVNTLAIQVNDKFWKGVPNPDTTAGVAYQLVLYDDPGAPELEAEFEATASIVESQLEPDANFTAEFSVHNDGPVTGDVRYYTILFDDRNNDGDYDFGDVIVDRQPTSSWSSRTGVAGGASFSPPNMTGQADLTQYTSGKVCAQINLAAHVPPNGSIKDSTDSACVSISKLPKLHIENGDITVGGSTIELDCAVDTGEAIIEGASDSTGASKSEFGVISMGRILDFGSNDNDYMSPAGRYGLFANTPVTGLFKGTGTVNNCFNSPFDHFAGATVVTPSDLPSGWGYSGGRYIINPTIMLSAGQRSIYLISDDADVYIRKNIQYPGSYNRLDDLPQFAILTRGEIFIDEDVTRLAGIYAADEGIHTCNNGTNPPRLSLTDCANQLVIDGAVYTGPEASIMVWRTFTDNNNPDNNAAEIFNLSPTVIMSEATNPESRQIETVLIEELPPRF